MKHLSSFHSLFLYHKVFAPLCARFDFKNAPAFLQRGGSHLTSDVSLVVLLPYANADTRNDTKLYYSKKPDFATVTAVRNPASLSKIKIFLFHLLCFYPR